MDDCHPEACKGAEKCNKKVKIWCKCKRLKKDFSCLAVRSGEATVKCDSICEEKKRERIQAQEAEMAKKRKEEELRNQREVEKFERKFKPKRKCKDKNNDEPHAGETRFNYLMWLGILLAIIVACLVTFFGVKV